MDRFCASKWAPNLYYQSKRSTATPESVDAMLRSDSPIGAMRQKISGDGTTNDRSTPATELTGFCRFKAFNTVLRHQLDDILAYGVFSRVDNNE